MALALRLFLLLLLAVALPARAAQAAPWPARGADLDRELDYLELLVNDTLKILKKAQDEPVGESDLASQPMSRSETLRDGEGVSAGNTFQAPLLITAHKPSSHRRGPPTGKYKAAGHKKPHEPSERAVQILKEMQQGGQEMDMEVLWKAAFPHGSSRSSAAPASRGKAMPGTGTGKGKGDGIAGKVSPLAWRYEVLKPSGPPAGVSAGRISPTPVLDAAHKSSSHLRGPPTEKTKHMADKKFLEPFESMREMLKEMLQGGQEVDGEAVLKAAFPEGRSVSSAGKKAMPDWDRDLDYLKGLLEYGLKFLEVAEDEAAGEGDLDSQPMSRSKTLRDGEGVSAGRISSPHGLDAAHKPGSHRRGKTHENGAKISLDSDESLRQTQKKAQGEKAVNQKSVQKEALPNGSTGSVPASTAGGTAMPGTGTGTDTGTGDAVGTSRHVPYSHKGIRKDFSLGRCFLLGVWFGLFFLVILLFCFLLSISAREIGAPLDSR